MRLFSMPVSTLFKTLALGAMLAVPVTAAFALLASSLFA